MIEYIKQFFASRHVMQMSLKELEWYRDNHRANVIKLHQAHDEIRQLKDANLKLQAQVKECEEINRLKGKWSLN
jgi:hypothetical protein